MKALRTALAVACVVVLIGVGLEVGGRLVTERETARQLTDAGVGEPDVAVGRSWWRPSILPALLGGTLDQVDVRLRDTRVVGIDVLEADYRLRDLSVDLDLRTGTVGVTALGSGSFRLLLEPAAITPLVGATLSARNGELRVGPREEPAALRVEGDELVIDSSYLRANGLVDRIVVVDTGLLPCDPDVAVIRDLVELSCSGDRLPQVLTAPLGARPAGDEGPPAELPPPASVERDGD